MLNVPNIVRNAANRLFLFMFMQMVVLSLTTMEAYHVALLEGDLYFFPAYVTSSSTSPNPMRETGLIPNPFSFVKRH